LANRAKKKEILTIKNDNIDKSKSGGIKKETGKNINEKTNKKLLF